MALAAVSCGNPSTGVAREAAPVSSSTSTTTAKPTTTTSTTLAPTTTTTTTSTTLPPTTAPPPPPTTTAPPTTVPPTTLPTADGAAVFAAECALCHGPTGAGDIGPSLHPLADPSYVSEAVGAGGEGMPSFAGTLSAAEIQAVALYAVALG